MGFCVSVDTPKYTHTLAGFTLYVITCSWKRKAKIKLTVAHSLGIQDNFLNVLKKNKTILVKSLPN